MRHHQRYVSWRKKRNYRRKKSRRKKKRPHDGNRKTQKNQVLWRVRTGKKKVIIWRTSQNRRTNQGKRTYPPQGKRGTRKRRSKYDQSHQTARGGGKEKEPRKKKKKKILSFYPMTNSLNYFF